MKGFKAFLLRGNVVDLAVAVVIGAAFTAVVSGFVIGLITPLIALIFGKHDAFSGFSFYVNGVLFNFAQLINAVVAFVIVAAIVYFLIVLPVNTLIERSRKAEPPDPSIRKCPECLSDIPTAARRCRYCGQPVTA